MLKRHNKRSWNTMHKTITTAALLTALSFSPAIAAQEFMFTYSKLFYQLKSNTSEGHDGVRLALFFNDAKTGKACTITKAWMEKEEHYEEFVIPDSQELPLPLDNNLKSANPLVYIQVEDNKQCNISLEVLASNPIESPVAVSSLIELKPQMQTMLSEIGGMFSRWFMPEVQGVIMTFNTIEQGQVRVSNGKFVDIIDHKAFIKFESYNVTDTLILPTQPDKVSPWLPSS